MILIKRRSKALKVIYCINKVFIEPDIDPHEFLKKIQQELNSNNLTSKQRRGLEDLKRSIQEDLGQTMIELEGDPEIDYSDESNESDELTPAEQQYLLYHHLQKEGYQFDIRHLDLPMFANEEQVEDFDEDMGKGFSPDFGVKQPQKAMMKGFRQAEIIDSMKPQYYFNAKNKSNPQRIYINDSDIDSKESTSKTPCFIGTPTSSSQIGSLNGTGAVKAEDLIAAIERSEKDINNRNKAAVNLEHAISLNNQISSSSQSSRENLKQVPIHITGMISQMSFGGEEGKKIVNPAEGSEYKNINKNGEFDTFRK